ncbi:hypothetical protein BDF14DRAFT_1996599 [Spinellus fusiger]|nr:hypothetical protein BDF14DRAFT_1996599 [Spinellus fusiger]
MAQWEKILLNRLDPYIKVILLQTKLAGPAASLTDLYTCDTPEELYLLLETLSPVHAHRTKTLVKLDKGDYFAGYTDITCVQEAQRTYRLLTPSDAAAHAIAVALYKTFPQSHYHVQQAPHSHHQRPHQKRRPREGRSGYQDLERHLEAQSKRMEVQEKQIKALLAQLNKGSLGKV